MNRTRFIMALVVLMVPHPVLKAAEVPEIAIVRPDAGVGFANAGWKYDRYSDLPSLDAGKAMTVADLEGPGIIRHLHTTRHQPKEIAARGVVLEIWFDDAQEPAVQCPLADFFGDGCNGQAVDFSTDLIECAPWSYNACYILRKVTLGGEPPRKLRLVVSGDPYEAPGKSDFVLQAGVWDGRQLHWFPEQVIEPASLPDANDWRTLEYELQPYAGQTIGLVVKAAYGGPKGICNEEAFFDELSVVPAR